MDKGSEVVARYVAAVEAHTNASASGDYRAANRAHDEIVKVYWRIRFSGNLDEVLSPLLRHDNPAVVLWAGTQLLCTGNALALRALEDVARRTDTHQAAYARLALEEWRAGRLELAPLESATSPVRELDAVQAEFLPKDTRYELLGKYHVPSGTLAIVGYVESHGSAIEIAGTLESGGYPINLQLDRLNQLIGVDFNTPKEEWKTLSVFPAIPAQRSAGGLRFAPEIVEQYYFELDAPLVVYADERGKRFLATFSEQNPDSAVELGTQCFALMNDNTLSGFQFSTDPDNAPLK